AVVHRFLKKSGVDRPASDNWARRYTVEGLRVVLPGAPAEIDAAVLADLARQAGQACAERFAGVAAPGFAPNDIENVLMDGLKGLHRFRNRPGPLGFASIDGSRLHRDMIIEFERPTPDIDCIELYSDGYPCLARKPTVAHWEAEFWKAEQDDPDRVDAYADTKGSSAEKYADDRCVLIVRPQTETLGT
ncbi:MAG: hypothetical protein ACC634_10860, partial [Hyphomicrobiales bacterium]